MKKVMIGILLIIPIVIMVTVGMVTRFVSGRTYIGVEEVVLDTNSVEIELTGNVLCLDDLIKVEVYPERATNRFWSWTIEDVKCLDNDYEDEYNKYLANPEAYGNDGLKPCACLVDDNGNAVEENTTGKFVVNSYCAFYAVAHAEQMMARCFVYVLGYEVQTVHISLDTDLIVGEKTLAMVEYNPIDSIVENVVWTVGDESIINIDKNGVVTALKEGKTTLCLFAQVYGTEDYVSSPAVEIAVEKGATECGNVIKTPSSTLPLEVVNISGGGVTFLNCSVDGNSITVADSTSPAYVVTDENTVEIIVVDEGDFEIENAEIFAYDEMKQSNFILSAGDNLYLNAVLSDSFATNKNIESISWSSDVPAVASVNEKGVVSGIKSGIATITATNTANGKSASILIRVENKVTALILAVTTKSLEVGLAKQTVFASSKYVSATDANNHEVENNTFTVDFMRPSIDNEDMYSSFEYKVLENGELSNKAHFENNVLVFDRENITDFSTLEIVISAKYPRYETVAQNTVASFELNVTDAVAVNSFVDLTRAANKSDKENSKTVCFESNVQVYDGDDKPYPYSHDMICAWHNVYGNGFMYSAKHKQAGHAIMYGGTSNVMVSNLIIRANEVGEEITTAEENVGLTGHCLIFMAGGDLEHFNDMPRLTNCRVEYCILENAKSIFQTRNTDVVIEGTIMRNSQGVGMHITASNWKNILIEYSHITMRNCVMSNMLGTGANFEYKDYSTNVSKEEVKQCIAEGKNIVFRQEGFLDMYNWQPTNTLNILAAAFAGDDLTPTLSSLVDSAGTIISTKLEGEKLKDKCSIYNGQKYFHLGFITTGLTEPSYLQASFEDDRFTTVTSDDLDLGALIKNPVTLYTYGNNDTKLSPASTYVVNSKLIERLHGNY